MAGALWTSYDALFPAIWVEAVKKPSRAGGQARARSSKASKLKRSSVPKAAHRSAATQQTASWLEKLGLGQYAKCFAENDITLAILRDLTDQDLKELGGRVARTSARATASHSRTSWGRKRSA
jgi:hypothetical protein